MDVKTIKGERIFRNFEKEKMEKEIINFLKEMLFIPRLNFIKWSKITKQTPNLKLGYPGQHLASLITNIEGDRTGARGNDLSDGTEVKSCNRVDQVDKCKDCGNKVMRIESECPKCRSKNIKRNNDSKWLFSIRNEKELKLLTEEVPRIFLNIADYPMFEQNDFSVIRIRAYEIWNNNERHKKFKEIMTNYYYNIYLKHKEKNPNKNPAPKNFWPDSYQFLICNPIKVFEAIVENVNDDKLNIKITHYISPEEDRSRLEAEKMPLALLEIPELYFLLKLIKNDKLIAKKLLKKDIELKINEFEKIFNELLDNKTKNKKILREKLNNLIDNIPDDIRILIPLREDKIFEIPNYNRL